VRVTKLHDQLMIIFDISPKMLEEHSSRQNC